MEILLVGINSRHYQISQSIRMLKKNSIPDAEILELNSKDTLIDHLEILTMKKYDIYAFSVYIWNYEITKKIIRALKKINPSSIVIVGGPQLAFEDLKYNFKQLCCDVIILGEGETPLKKIYKDISIIKSDMSEFGIYSKDLNYEKKEINDYFEKDLSSIDLIDKDDIKDKVLSFAYTETSRGCPFDCSYCTSGNKIPVRNHPVDKVLKNISSLSASGINTLRVIDRTFNVNEKRAMSIMSYILKNCPDILYQFEIRADIMSDEFLEFLRNVPKGRFQLEIGVQTLNPKVLEKVERKEKENRLLENIRGLTEKRNLSIHLDLIAGLPDDYIESVFYTIDILGRLMPDILQINILKMLPGTSIIKKARDYNILFESEPPYSVLKSDTFTFEDIRYIDNISKTINVFYNSNFLKNSFFYLINKKQIPASVIFRQLCDHTLKKKNRIHSIARMNVYRIFVDFLNTTGLFDEEFEKIVFLDHTITSKDPKERFQFKEKENMVIRKEKKQKIKKTIFDENTVFTLKNIITKDKKKFPEKENLYDKELYGDNGEYYCYFSYKEKKRKIIDDIKRKKIVELIYDKKANSLEKMLKIWDVDKEVLEKELLYMLEEEIITLR